MKSAAKAVAGFITENCRMGILLFNAASLGAVTVLFYFITPVLWNYAPGFAEYTKEYTITYWVQFLILYSAGLILTSAAALFALRGVAGWKKVLEGAAPDRESRISSIRRKCLSLPYILFLQHVLIPISILILYTFLFITLFDYRSTRVIDIVLLALTFFLLTADINYLFSKLVFRKILFRTSIYYRLEGKRVLLRGKIMLQILPIFIVAVLFTSLLGYSRLLEDRASLLSRLYNDELQDHFRGVVVKSLADVAVVLKSVDVDGTRTEYFVIKPDGSLVVSGNSKLDRQFVTYLYNYSDEYGGRVYDETGSNGGTVIEINSPSGLWHAGVRYSTSLKSAVTVYEVNFIVIVLLLVLTIYIFSRTMSSEISHVAENLNRIAQGFEENARLMVPVTSNDEVGDLVVAFNKIRECQNQVDRMKDEFIANISHEFRTPLNLILSAVQLTGRLPGRPPEECPEHARLGMHMSIIRQNCFRLLKLVSNLIDSTKLDSNHFSLHRRNCDIVEHIRNITVSVGDYIKVKGITLTFEADVDKKFMAVDMDAIERVILNLLSNAVKFNRQGGHITVAIFDRGENVEIRISDNGIGIPEDKLRYIFKRFVQVDNMLTKRSDGSGIGLSIVKSLIDMHKGTIAVESKGRGTSFSILLPVEILQDEPLKGEDLFEGRFSSGLDKIDIEFSDV